MAPVVSATSPSTMGKKLVNASLNGKDDDIRELLKTATTQEVNWQNKVRGCIIFSLSNDNIHFLFCFIVTEWKFLSYHGIVLGVYRDSKDTA